MENHNCLEEVYVVSEVAKEFNVTSSYISMIIKRTIEDDPTMLRKAGRIRLISKKGRQEIADFLKTHRREN